MGSSRQLTMGAATQTPPPPQSRRTKKDKKSYIFFFYFWVPRNQLGFKLAGSVVAHKYGSRMERENHLTTDLLQMSTNENILGFLKKKKDSHLLVQLLAESPL